MTLDYMIACKKNGHAGYLDDGLLFTQDVERAAIIPSEQTAYMAIRLAKQGACGADNFCVVSAEFFRPPTRDLPCLSNAT